MATATEHDRIAVARFVLDGLARDEPLDDVLRRLRPFADYTFPFPGDVLTEIAATALEIAGATPATPLSLSNATERHLPEWTISGNTARQKYRAALQAAVALHAGILVDYDEVAGWWQLQDYTLHAFEAAVVLTRMAAAHTQRSTRSICEAIAARRGVPLADG
jgi:hypothetical protein